MLGAATHTALCHQPPRPHPSPPPPKKTKRWCLPPRSSNPKCAAGTSFTDAWRVDSASVAFVWQRPVPAMFRAAIHEAGHVLGEALF